MCFSAESAEAASQASCGEPKNNPCGVNRWWRLLQPVERLLVAAALSVVLGVSVTRAQTEMNMGAMQGGSPPPDARDPNAYSEGALDIKTKELLGLVASAVLRCDDCVKYHLESSFNLGASKEEVMETLSIATLVGGTIVVPHLRRAFEFWEELENAKG